MQLRFPGLYAVGKPPLLRIVPAPAGRESRGSLSFLFEAPAKRGRKRLFECLFDVCNEVGGVFQTAGIAHEIRGDAGGEQFRVGHLAVRGAGGMETAGARIGNVRLDRGNF